MSATVVGKPEAGMGERIARLLVGLCLFGVGLALMLRAELGLGPWDVFHQGLAKQVGVQIGWVTIVTSAVVLLAWIPLRQRPGIGTVCNVVLVGLSVNLALDVLPPTHALAVRWAALIAGILAIAVGTGLYVGAGFGPGPRDGLMTGLAARGVSIRVSRTITECLALALGVVAGGTIGIGTALFAVAIGPLVHRLIPLLAAPNGQGPRHD